MKQRSAMKQCGAGRGTPVPRDRRIAASAVVKVTD